MTETPPPSNGASAAVGTAIANLRETAKWIITVLAGVGAVLTAGVQLSNIGRLSLTDPRLWLAVAAAILTLVLIGLAISRAVGVLTGGHVTLDSLVKDETGPDKGPNQDVVQAKEAGFLPAHYNDSVARFRDEYRNAKGELLKAEAGNNEAQKEKWRREVDELGNGVMPQLFAGVRYYRVRRRFDEAIRWLLGIGFFAALGIITFAWATNPPEPTSDPSPFRTPVEASVVLTQDGKDSLGESLGDECVESSVRVLVLSASDTTADVVSMPTGGCEVDRFTVVEGESGRVKPAEPVTIPREN